jgi:methyl-accepting chemotaxis protein
MTRVAAATVDARGTAADVRALAEALANEAESLDANVRQFLDEVRVA